ncbi:MAG: hypothetical protein LBE33_08565 [Zoogloeaceae bacterium]|jgi:hypothetical protein|nr:hypothetical protein [Zoogloeaceae bacterium]
MAVRIRNRFHAAGRAREPAELASVLAMLSWKLAVASIKQMREAGFDIDLGQPYFDYIVETMAFHAHYADRLAYAQLTPEQRGAFTAALARRMAEIIEDNADMLPAAPAPGACRRHCLSVFNAAGADYAAYGCEGCDGDGGDGGAEPDFGFRRAYALRLRESMPEKDKAWIYDQVMEIEAPESARAIGKTLAGLFSAAPEQA